MMMVQRNNTSIRWLVALSITALMPLASPAIGKHVSSVRATEAIPVHWEANKGQAVAEVDYLARHPAYTVFLSGSEAVIRLPMRASGSGGRAPGAVGRHVLRMGFVNANGSLGSEGLDRLSASSNYLRGSDSSDWVKNVPHFRRVRYEELYSGIDVVYRSDAGRLRFDLVLEPGSDPDRIGFRFDGVERIEVDGAGNLKLETPAGTLIQHSPVVYQELDGEREPIEAEYQVGDSGTVGFKVASYNRSEPLVIDPTLSFSTYIGGSASEIGVALDSDDDGSIVIVGHTDSVDIPIENPIQSGIAGARDIYALRVDPSNGDIVHATFLGGSKSDFVQRTVVDNEGSVVMVGRTLSSDFPAVNAVQPTFKGGAGLFGAAPEDGFVTKLSPDGASLIFSTYLGGFDTNFPFEFMRGLDVDMNDNIYVSGETGSADFPATHDLQPGGCGSSGFLDTDAVVAKYRPDGTLVFATCYGGSLLDRGRGLSVDAGGDISVTGFTASSLDFPVTPNAFQTVHGGPSFGFDGYVVKLGNDATAIEFASYLGGRGDDTPEDVDVDDSGNAYVVGMTASPDYPVTSGAYQTVIRGGLGEDPVSPVDDIRDGTIAKIDGDSGVLKYASFLGGSGDEELWGVRVDPLGRALVLGFTDSNDFPLVDPVQGTFAGVTDAYVTRLNEDGSQVEFSTYLGGTGRELVNWGLGRDLSGNIYAAGTTNSVDFPLVDPVQSGIAGSNDLFVTRLSPDLALEADLQVTGSVEPDTAKPADALRYVFSVHNEARDAADGVILHVVAPAGFDEINVNSEKGECEGAPSEEGLSLTCGLGTLGAGVTVNVSLQGRVGRPGEAVAVATVRGNPGDPDGSNNHSVTAATIRQP